MAKQAKLLLEDGTLFVGEAFGSETESFGEVVFNTGITGYQEVLSDPSYCGQIVTMTYPLIGNYGISREDFEAIRSYVSGLVVREQEQVPSNWRAQFTLDSMLKDYDVPGISGIDTRMLTRKIRHFGTMKGVLSTKDVKLEELQERLNGFALIKDQVARVSTKHIYGSPGNGARVVLIDYGSKNGIFRDLIERGCAVVVVPHDTTAEQIRRLKPDGIMLSNGPGDPKDVPHAIQTVSELMGEYPIFGICLGHQLIALACGADTTKLKFGHRGGNHPVRDLQSNRCYITSQNHGYTVLEDSLAGTGLQVTHINNNDKTIEGLKHVKHPVFSVQYHPEATPGPDDSSYLFDDFVQMIRDFKAGSAELPKQAQFIANRKGDLAYVQK